MYSVVVYSYYKEVADKIAEEIKATRKEFMEIIKYDNPFLALMGSVCEGGYDIVIFHVVNPNEMEFSRRMKFYHNNTVLIYLLNKPKIIPQLRKTEPFACIVYEDEYDQFGSILDDAFTRVQSWEGLLFEYMRGRQKYLADLNDIAYFYSDHRVVRFKDKNSNEDFFYSKLDDVEPIVCGMTNKFLRANKSYLVNRLYIKKYEDDKIIMEDGTFITMKNSYNEHKNIKK